LSNNRQGWTAALALYAVAWTVLSWPWLSGAVTIPWDAKAHFYPQLQFLAQSIHRGEWPFWAPYVFSGSPQVADPQSLIFSLPFLALAALDPNPGFQAFDAVILGSLGTGGVAILLIFRDRGWHPAGALVAAIAFAFGASAAWRVQHVEQALSLAAWPLALWLLLRALRRSSLAYGVLSGFAAGVMALGRDQVAFLALVVLAGAVVAHWVQSGSFRTSLRLSVGPLLAGVAAGALVVTVPIVLTSLLAEGSNRAAIAYGEAAKGSVHPALLLTAMIPNLFGVDGPFTDYWGPPSPRWGMVDLVLARNMGVLYLGALPFALLLAGALKGVLWAREVRFFTIALASTLLFALGGYTPIFRIMFGFLPGVDLFRRPADATFLVGALAAILAGYLVHRLWSGTFLRRGPPWTFGEVAVAMACFAAALALAVSKGTVAIAAWPIAKASLCLAAAVALLSMLPTLRVQHPRTAIALLFVGLVADLAWNNGPNESTALPPAMYDALRPDSRNETLAFLKQRLGPDSLDRVELAGLGFHWPNASLVHRLHNVLGYNPLRLALYTRATGAGDHVALPEQRNFSPLFPSYRSTLANLLGLRLIVTGVPIERIDPQLKPGDVTLLARTADGFVYENASALPRVSFATKAVQIDPVMLLKNGNWPDVDFATTVLLQDIEAGPTAAQRDGVAVTVETYRTTEVWIDVHSQGGGYVVLSDPYHPWWVAEVDGREEPILHANLLFRAVRVGAGNHRVRFAFRPFRGAWRDLCRRWPVLNDLALHSDALACGVRRTGQSRTKD
jgi:hypothetical protein